MIARASIASLGALSLAACSVTPTLRIPAPPAPASWPKGDTYLMQNEAALPVVSYSQIFIDPRLRQLIETALVENRDLRVAAADLAAARAQVRAVRSAQYPQIGIDGSVDVSRSGSGTSSNGNAGAGAGDSTRTVYSVRGGVASYELDLFGRYENATAAERDRALATEAFARTVRLGLVADIAAAWATYAADSDLLLIAKQTAANARESVRLTDLRLKGGVAPRTDLAQAQQVLASAELAIAEQTSAQAQGRNLLRLLVGTDFDDALLPASIAEIAPSYQALPAGLDSQVLLRRPDVIEAEYQLRAAGADVAVARANLFPALSLTGLAGLASTALADLLTGGAFNFTAGAGLGYSIFDGGGRRAQVAVSEARREAALAAYERTIQTAFREVSDTLAEQGTLTMRARAAQDNTAAATTTARLTEARYRNGIDSFLESLIAQRSLFAARQQRVQIELAILINRTDLYRVLGGDQAASDISP